MKIAIFALLLIGLAACSNKEILPEKMTVKVSRDEPAKDCRSIGLIQGRSTKINPTSEEVLEDLKKEAALKGANYVMYENMGSFGGYMRGQGYYCP